MELNLHDTQLVTLIHLAKDEVYEREQERTALAESQAIAFNNDMNLHRAMITTLTSASQFSITPPVSVPPGEKSVILRAAFKCEDPFSEAIFKRIRKQAMYFGCFIRGSNDYPDLVIKEVKDLLKIETITLTRNDVDLQFINIVVLMTLLNKNKFEIESDKVILVAESKMNGSQPYIQITVNDNSLPFVGNKFQIKRTTYSYESVYTYLEMAVRTNESFSGVDGNSLIDLPIGVLRVLNSSVDVLVHELTKGELFTDVFNAKFDEVVQELKEIVDICQTKFSDNVDKVLTPEERIVSIRHYISSQLEWNRSWNFNGMDLPRLKSNDFHTNADNTAIFFESDIPTYVRVDGHYRKTTMKFRFDHLGVNNFIELFGEKDIITMIQDYWVLVKMLEDLRFITYSARELRELGEYGRHY